MQYSMWPRNLGVQMPIAGIKSSAVEAALVLCDPLESNVYTSRGAYTVWEQSSNGRYANHGSRIDFTLLDESLRPCIIHPTDNCYHHPFTVASASAAATNSPATNNVQPTNSSLSAVSTLLYHYHTSAQAYTLNGEFQPAALQGGGIPPAKNSSAYVVHLDVARLDVAHLRFGMIDNDENENGKVKANTNSATGIICSPPEYSDHVKVCVHLRNQISIPTPPPTLAAM